MGLIAFVLLGIVAGVLGRLVLPRGRSMAPAAAAVVGMLGAVLGGVLGALLSGEGLQLGTAGLIGSVLGVVVALFVVERRGRVGGSATNRT